MLTHNFLVNLSEDQKKKPKNIFHGTHPYITGHRFSHPGSSVHNFSLVEESVPSFIVWLCFELESITIVEQSIVGVERCEIIIISPQLGMVSISASPPDIEMKPPRDKSVSFEGST